MNPSVLTFVVLVSATAVMGSLYQPLLGGLIGRPLLASPLLTPTIATAPLAVAPIATAAVDPAAAIADPPSESICELNDYINIKCPTGDAGCKLCVLRNVQYRCPYFTAQGPPNCEALKLCALNLHLRCNNGNL